MKLFKYLLVIAGGMYAMNIFAMGYSTDYVECMKSSNNQANTTSTCQFKELKYQNKRLKKLLKITSAFSTDQEKVNLKRIQTQWSAQRELSCGLKNKKLKELNAAGIGCALQMTSSRADMLEVQVTNKNLRR